MIRDNRSPAPSVHPTSLTNAIFSAACSLLPLFLRHPSFVFNSLQPLFQKHPVGYTSHSLAASVLPVYHQSQVPHCSQALPFHTIANSLSQSETPTPVSSTKSKLLRQNTRGMGYSLPFLPASRRWLGDAPSPDFRISIFVFRFSSFDFRISTCYDAQS